MRINRQWFCVVVVTVVLVTLFPESLPAQCVMCGASIESSEDGENIIKGVKKGIAYLMLFPYVLMGAVAYFWYRNYKKNKQN